jgi:hypothetical protein
MASRFESAITQKQLRSYLNIIPSSKIVPHSTRIKALDYVLGVMFHINLTSEPLIMRQSSLRMSLPLPPSLPSVSTLPLPLPLPLPPLPSIPLVPSPSSPPLSVAAVYCATALPTPLRAAYKTTDSVAVVSASDHRPHPIHPFGTRT